MTLPVLPLENEDPWFTKRNAFDLAVKADLEGRLSDAALSATFGVDAAARALFHSLDVRDNRALTVAIAADSTSDSDLEWFETSWRLALRDIWPERPARLYAWDNTTNAYMAVESWQAGDGVLPMFTAYNASVAGSTLNTQRTYFASMFTVAPDVLFINHGHNYANTITPAAFLADIDGFVGDFRAVYPDTPVVLFSQNTEFTTGIKTSTDVAAHKARQIALADHAREKGYGYIAGWEAFAQEPNSGQALVNVDGVHPTPCVTSEAVITGARLQANVAGAWIRERTKRPILTTVPDLGIPGWDHLYDAARIFPAGAEPALAASSHFWWDQGAAHESMSDAAGTTAGAAVAELSGIRYLSINTPPASAMGKAWTNVAKPRTLLAVVRTAQLTVNFLQAVGYRVRRITGGSYGLSNGTDEITVAGTNSFAIVVIVMNGPASVLAVNGVEVVASTAFAPGASVSPSGITIGTGSATDYTPFDFALIASWPRAFTAGERATILSVMQARFAAILV